MVDFATNNMTSEVKETSFRKKKVENTCFNRQSAFTTDYIFSPNVGKYEPEKTPCLDSFHAVAFIGLDFEADKPRMKAELRAMMAKV